MMDADLAYYRVLYTQEQSLRWGKKMPPFETWLAQRCREQENENGRFRELLETGARMIGWVEGQSC
jgi:hypothetical protein